MLKKFALWFICFGLSFLVESLGWAEQGKAFMLIHLGVAGLITVLLILACIFEGDDLEERLGMPVLVLLAYGVLIAIILFTTWGATKLFNVDCYVAFQLMTFGQCLCFSNKEDD